VYRQIATLAMIAFPALIAPSAAAQEVRDIEPAWRVIDRDAVQARSGPDAVYYTVMELAANRVLRADGETDLFTRVRYPAGSTLLVPVDEVRVVGQDADGSTRVELIKASGLRSPSELMGMSGSWMTVYDPALPEGTTLRVTEAVKNEAGDVVGYRVWPVEPPASEGFARLYVETTALRDATPEEIERHLAAPEWAAGSGVVDPAETNTTGQGEPEAEPEAVAVEPVAGDDAAATDPEPVELSQGEPAVTRTNRPAVIPAGLEALEASFEAARKQPASEVDQALDELLAEFKRTRAATDSEDRLAWQLDQRIEWLKLRIETRDQRRAIRAALAQADERATELEAQVKAWQLGRSYQLVGLLTESSVYNGERLARMYRVQAINTIDGSPRTLGYLTPGDGVDGKVGSVVGIIGQARFDPQLRLMVIRPERIDVMPR